MVFVRDLKSEFFNAIVPNRVVIFAALDLDSVCATKILQNLFFVEGVLYTIVPVLSLEEIESKFLEISRGIKNFIFINCGATVDLVEVLQPPEGVIFYICDWHRPIDIANVYNAVQVKLLIKQDELTANIPAYDDVYRDEHDENEDDEEGEENDEDGGESLEALQRKKKKREERARWEQHREEILFKYSEFSFFSRPSAIYCFELAHALSRDSNDSLFLALVSLTSAFLMGQTTHDTYISEMKSVGVHANRLNRRPTSEPNSLSVLNLTGAASSSSSVHVPGNQMRLTLREDLLLDLYRQWTLYDSLLRTESTACHFRVWTARGMARLREFLADCGIPPSQSQQRFASTSSELRRNVKKYIEERIEKYGMEPSSLIYPVYWLYMGYLYDLSLGDIAMCALGMLEPGNCLINSAADQAANIVPGAPVTRKDVRTIHSCFAKAGEALSLKHNIDALLSEGGEHARSQVMAISDAAWSVVQARSIARLGPLLYTTLPPMRAHTPILVQPLTFTRFARYLQHAFCSDVKNVRIRSLPFVVLATYPHDESLLVACGLQPLASVDDEKANCFGKAFEQAAVVSRSRVKPWTFDHNLILIRKDDKDKFMDALVALLS